MTTPCGWGEQPFSSGRRPSGRHSLDFHRRRQIVWYISPILARPLFRMDCLMNVSLAFLALTVILISCSEPESEKGPQDTGGALDTGGSGGSDSGGDQSGEIEPPALTRIASGNRFSCALDAGGAISCWGDADDGRLDAPEGSFTQIEACSDHACAVASNGTVECWGEGDEGELSPPSGVFTAVATGQRHSCGIDASGAIQCWGLESSGLSDVPQGEFVQISCGRYSCCALDTLGHPECWGDNEWGQTEVPDQTFGLIALGYVTGAGISLDGSLTSWADTETACREEGGYSEAPITGEYVSVKAREAAGCAIDSTGSVSCWGCNPDHEYYTTPSEAFVEVAPGSDHVCGRTTADEIVCWGENGSGQASPP
jgi:hypothetical protein